MAYSSAQDAIDRVPYYPISATSSPTLAVVESWHMQTESVINAALAAAQISTAGITADGTTVLGELATMRLVGLIKEAFATAGGAENENGRKEIERFEESIRDIRSSPSQWEAMIHDGSASSSTGRMRGAPRSVDGPVFTRSELF